MIGTAATITAIAGAATWAGFHTMWPTSQVYGRTFTGLARGTKLLALTYDDGPNDAHTPRLLDVLARHDVKATFFMIGRYVHERSQIARAVAQAGHDVGSHTYTHPNLALCSKAQIEFQISSCERMLTDVIGPHAPLFRPPFGGRRPVVLSILSNLGLAPVMWNITSYDWNMEPAPIIERRIMRHIRGGDVILMHDGGHLGMGADRSQTVLATDALITRYKNEGYRFVTISEMMAAQNTTAAPLNHVVTS